MKKFLWTAIGVLFIIFLLFGYLPRAYRGSKTIMVTDKERINYEEKSGSMKSKYLIYADDEVYENVDDWFYFKWNSSNLYGQLQEGEQYKIWTAGWRMPIFSTYQNIIAIERIP